jgi:hypothetical protein
VQVALVLSSNTLNTAGIILLTMIAVEYGGWFMLRVVRGRQPATPFQQAFSRARARWRTTGPGLDGPGPC